jgi:hypothetical protein
MILIILWKSINYNLKLGYFLMSILIIKSYLKIILPKLNIDIKNKILSQDSKS